MSTSYVPGSLLDAGKLPPLLLTSEAGSFARFTFETRIPRIIDETIALNPFPPDIRGALERLRTEITSGEIQPLDETAPDVGFWEQVSAPYFGRQWLDVPWYWAEAYFYRRVLAATRYFQPGPWLAFDPFAVMKAAEWVADAAPLTTDALLSDLPLDVRRAGIDLLMASLWGNRVDLSYKAVAARGIAGQLERQQDSIIVNHAAAAWDHLKARTGELLLICDNAGTELAMDLALVDHLLTHNLVAVLTLHVKPQPFFVSDAMAGDVEQALAALPSGGELGARLASRLREYLSAGRLRMATHWFYATSLFYYEMPADLYETLAAATLVIVKGDANYRRLIGDLHWPPSTSFAGILAYFPAPVVSLRTLKSELIAGLPVGQAERLAAADPQWLVNGRRGVIQARL